MTCKTLPRRRGCAGLGPPPSGEGVRRQLEPPPRPRVPDMPTFGTGAPSLRPHGQEDGLRRLSRQAAQLARVQGSDHGEQG
jgi:hypothetical protein